MNIPFPQQNKQVQNILNELESFKINDMPWKSGKIFAYVYDAGEEAQELMRKAFGMYLSENALDPTVFPSLLKLETDIIGMATNLVNGDEKTVGNFTTGGTESIMLALKTARDFNRINKPSIKNPEVILPHTAHASFQKACHFLNIKPVITTVDKTTFLAIPEEIEKSINENTILMVASAPSYAHGVIDPIPEIGKIALKNNLLFHVDACVGGMYLPFLKKLGYDIPNFDFSVEGVTSLSMDFHKFGYAAKGASAILYKNSELRKHQLFVNSNWAGYTMINTTVLSTKSGGSMAACWATLNYLGTEGYLKNTRITMEATKKMIEGIKKIRGLEILGNPQMNLFAIASDELSVFRLSDLMREKGWFLQPQLSSSSSKENIHFSVNPSNTPHIEQLLLDLQETVDFMYQNPEEVDIKSILEILQNPQPDTLDKVAQILGLSNGAVPEKMETINALLNVLPVSVREYFLTEFMNQMYT